MIKGIGNDIVEIERIANALQSQKQHFLDKIFTFDEQAYCLRYRDPTPQLAGRFCAKEAISKALGVGICSQLDWLDLSIINDDKGKPHVIVSPKAQAIFNSPNILLSISHCRNYATAMAIWLSD
ncbi:MAG: acpS [Chlamydiales bacterium]|jgi:holo-[acyl-carrier protein] synthase|nr:acpS [Chlamydiales bacterium]